MSFLPPHPEPTLFRPEVCQLVCHLVPIEAHVELDLQSFRFCLPFG